MQICLGEIIEALLLMIFDPTTNYFYEVTLDDLKNI